MMRKIMWLRSFKESLTGKMLRLSKRKLLLGGVGLFIVLACGGAATAWQVSHSKMVHSGSLDTKVAGRSSLSVQAGNNNDGLCIEVYGQHSCDKPPPNTVKKSTSETQPVKSAEPAQLSTVASGHSTSPPGTAYKPPFFPSCTYISIPYHTIYEDDPTSYIGQNYTKTYGLKGEKETCTTPNNGPPTTSVVYPATDEVILRGTKTSSSGGSGYTYSQALAVAQQNCGVILGNAGAGSSSAMSQCIAAELHQYGY
ncbi:MAG: G5 domain-containing protein [Candidatus Saccharimonadales bacterium]